MSYRPANPNGQTTSVNSTPIVIASDQSTVPISASSLPLPSGAAQDSTLTGGSAKLQGNVAAATTDSGNTVKVGGKYNATPPTYTDGQRGDLQLDAGGNLKVTTSAAVTIASNSSVNVNQLGGTATDTNSGSKSAGTLRVVLATDQPQLTNALKVDGSAVTQPVSGTMTVQQSTAGNLKVDLSGTAANTTAIKVDGSAVTQPVSLAPSSSTGWSVSSQTALTNTKASIKASTGTLGGYMLYNPNAAAVYIQVFDVASGSVTLGTTTPTYVIPLPPAAAANIEFALGIAHGTAIVAAATTTATGSAAPSSSITGFFLYK